MFKSRSSKFFFVHPNLSKNCTQSVSLVVYYMIVILEIRTLADMPFSRSPAGHAWETPDKRHCKQ